MEEIFSLFLNLHDYGFIFRLYANVRGCSAS